MSSPWLALKRTSTTALVAIESSASVINNSATAIADLAAVGSAHARYYRAETETILNQDAQRRINRRIHTLAVEDAEFYDELEQRLAKNPKLQAHYDRSIESYKKPVLSVAPE